MNEKENTDKYRLPTEAEWEYTARAWNDWHLYSWGNSKSKVSQYAWHKLSESNKRYLRLVNRYSIPPSYKNHDIGFRLVGAL